MSFTSINALLTQNSQGWQQKMQSKYIMIKDFTYLWVIKHLKEYLNLKKNECLTCSRILGLDMLKDDSANI